MFKTIESNVSAEIVEKKSKFIANIYYVESIEEAEKLIKDANKKYFDARHNCYAFRVCTENGIVNRFSDDGEPSGTAGAPMLNILTSQNLSNVLIIVTRYFGGILLGTGGLVKAYTQATIEALNKANIAKKDFGESVKFVVGYSDLEKLKYFLKQNSVRISDVQYVENVEVFVDCTDEKLKEILVRRNELNFEIIYYEIIGEKFIVVD